MDQDEQKRERAVFAALALQGMLSNPIVGEQDQPLNKQEWTERAVTWADELMEALARTEPLEGAPAPEPGESVVRTITFADVQRTEKFQAALEGIRQLAVKNHRKPWAQDVLRFIDQAGLRKARPEGRESVRKEPRRSSRRHSED